MQSQNQQQTPQMTDRDYLNDILATEKYLSDSFNVAAREASHDALFEDVLGILQDTQRCARQVYNVMYQKGWYKLEQGDTNQVAQIAQQFQGYMQNQFPTQQGVH